MIKKLIASAFLSVVLAGLLLLLIPDPPQAASRAIVRVKTKTNQEVTLYQDYQAVVIGVGEYKHLPRLAGAVRDAKEVSARLKALGFSVRLHLNPTSNQLKNILNSLPYSIGRKEDRALLIYYAGHGETETYADGTKLGYITASDCPVLSHNPAGFAVKSVSMEAIESLAKKIKSRHVLMAFDSCFSGALFNLARATPRDISEKVSRPVRLFVTAGNEDEEVPDQSVFKTVFLDGISGEADYDRDGYVTGSELGMYLQKGVVNYTRGAQHPQFGKIRNPRLDKGDFVFVLPKPAQPAPVQTANLAPPAAFKLEDLQQQAQRDREVRLSWQRWQESMEDSFRQVQSFEKGVAEPALKVSAWERFLITFKQDNPFSRKDESMRGKARKRLGHWRVEAGRPAPQATAKPTTIPQPIIPKPAHKRQKQKSFF